MNIEMKLGPAVREACEAFLEKHGRMPERDEVVSDFVARGKNRESVRSEVSRWRSMKRQAASHLGEQPAPFKTASEGWDGHYPLNVTPEGDLVIPRALLDAMMLDPDGRVTAHVKDGELHIISPMAAIRRAQRIAKSLDRGEGSVVDELISERRAEAARENEDA